MKIKYRNKLVFIVPVLWYLLGSLLKKGPLSFDSFIISFMGVAFISFILFSIYKISKILYIHVKEDKKKWQNIITIIIFIGALCGLLLNESLDNLFGDFSHELFYLGLIFTCLTLYLSNRMEKHKVVIFILQSISFSYTVYFFIVFIGLLPLSIVGIVFFGLGLLMMMPLFLMVVHCMSLYKNFNLIKIRGGKISLSIIFVLCINILPASIYLQCKDDKENFNKAMEYVYEHKDLDQNIKPKAIKRTLNNMVYIKGLAKNDRGKVTIPYFVDYYEKYILEGQTISKSVAKKIEEVFIGDSSIITWNEDIYIENDNIEVKKINVDTVYDKEEKIYKSTINMKIENKKNSQNEFRTKFKLGDGAFISNYYLVIDGEKEYGLLADKRAANWIYEREKRRKYDPGILTYIGNNEIMLKIFPFNKREIRTTGIEIIHKEPMNIAIEGNDIELKADIKLKEKYINDDYAYISGKEKSNLKKVIRSNKYYFIIDFSNSNKKYIEESINNVLNYINENDLDNEVKEVICLNYKEDICNLNEFIGTKLEGYENEGGFYLEKSLKRIFSDNYKSGSKERPIIIVSSSKLENPVLDEYIKNYSFTSPEDFSYFHLKDQNQLEKKYILTRESTKVKNINRELVLECVINHKFYYLKNDLKGNIILLNSFVDMNKHNPINGWEQGMLLKAKSMSNTINSDNNVQNTFDLVKRSIKYNIMSNKTSFISLENNRQKELMLKKQDIILNSKTPIKLGDIIEMSEPSYVIYFVIGIFILYIRKLLY